MQDKTPTSHDSLSHLPPQGFFDEQEAMAKLVPIADELVALVQKARAPQCLHQIQEPSAAEQAAWHAGLDEGRAQAAQNSAADVPASGAVALSEYLKTCEQHAIVPDVGGAFASAFAAGFNLAASREAPAAVAVPDECAAFEAKFRHLDLSQKPDAWGHARYSHDAISLAWEAWQARAALAATPAAAAPVVLPESAGPIIEKLLALARIVDIAVEDWGESLADGSMDVKFHSDVVTELESILDHFDGLPEGPDDNVIESGPVKAARILRALVATATGLPAQAFQQRVQPWMMACFGPEISADSRERNHRFLEEALELVQSCGCTASEAHQLVDYVYGRPWGEPAQEAGGVMVTLAALCLANGLDMHACGETELARIWTKVEAIRAKQAAKPKHSPLPMHVAQADARDAESDYQRGYRHGYNRRDAEVQGALL